MPALVFAFVPMGVGCQSNAPMYRGLRVDLAVQSGVRVETRVQPGGQASGQMSGQASGQISGQVSGQVDTPTSVPAPPLPPPSAVALEGAPVVEFFGVPLDGAQDVVFVLDRSGSMSDPARGHIAQLAVPADPMVPGNPDTGDLDTSGDPDAPGGVTAPVEAAPVVHQIVRKIDVARAELIHALERLPAGTRINVVLFNNGIEASAPGILPLEEVDRERLIQFVESTFPAGRTALAPAMRTAFLLNARRIVLLSDGLGNLGGDARAVLRDARQAIRGGVRIDTIGLGWNRYARLLQVLARESGGLYQPL